jgi:predicted  nucleic acid-binding Zn-ribbon protein
MSPIGRIFLVLNLILSAVFLGWASNVLATSQDYKTQLSDKQAEWETERTALETELSDIRAQLNVAENTASTARAERDNLKAENDRNSGDLAAEVRANTDLRASVSNFESQLGTLAARLDDIASSKDRAIEEARAAERERDTAAAAQQEAEMARRDAEARMGELENMLADVRKDLTSTKRKFSSVEAQLATMVTLHGPAPATDTPKIDARITGVEADLRLVMLNVGESQGVRRGMTFDVYAGSVYKGRVSVLNTDDNQSSAKILTQPDGTSIAQGDNATTLL